MIKIFQVDGCSSEHVRRRLRAGHAQFFDAVVLQRLVITACNSRSYCLRRFVNLSN
jgi:hypothetical protein